MAGATPYTVAYGYSFDLLLHTEKDNGSVTSLVDYGNHDKKVKEQ